MPSRSEDIPHIWTPRLTYRFYPRPRSSPQSPQYSKPPLVPYKGAFAGLKPKRRNHAAADADSDSRYLQRRADDLIAEAEDLESQVPRPTLSEMLGSVMLERNVDTDELIKAWDPTSSGSIVKSECRLRLKGIFSQFGNGSETCTQSEIDSIFDSVDLDGSGVIDWKEARKMIASLKQAAQKFNSTEKLASRERMERSKRLRGLAKLAIDAGRCVADAIRLEDALQHFKVEMAVDLEAQLGLACARRRIKAADFVGQFASGPSGLSCADFVKMVHSLVSSAADSEASSLFRKIDTDGSGLMDLKEAFASLSRMQQRGDELQRDRDGRTRAQERMRLRADKKVRAVKEAERADRVEMLGMSPLSSPLSSPARRQAVSPQPTDQMEKQVEKAAAASSSWRLRRSKQAELQWQQVYARLSHSHLTKGWNTWLEFAQSHGDMFRLMRMGVLHIMLSAFQRVFNTWTAFRKESLRRRRVMKDALARLRSQELSRGFAAWRASYSPPASPASPAPPAAPPRSLCEAFGACLANPIG